MAAASTAGVKMKRLLLAAALGLFTASAAAQTVVIQGHDLGGFEDAYIAKYNSYANRGYRVVVAGDCASACTLALHYGNACVLPNARLRFHSAMLALPGPGGRIIAVRPGRSRDTARFWRMIPWDVRARLHPLSNRWQVLYGWQLPRRYRCHRPSGWGGQ
jgi:hypothetical protein